MIVGVTGGTGFVGAHSVAAVVAAGHRVRLLARTESAVQAALGPLDIDRNAVDVVTGDITDRAAVAAAVRGADAVLHAAGVYSFDARRRAELRRVNIGGTEVVLAAARRAGAGRIVHVSTFGALLPAPGATLRADAPVGRPREAYMASKAAAERIAREHREQGAPVLITYPPGLLGPHDPHLGDQNRRLRDLLRGLMPVWPRGGFPIGDVRDTAALHTALLTAPANGADRYFTPGRYLTTREYVRAVRAATGRGLPAMFLPARPMLPFGRCVDLAQRIWPWHIPAEYGAIYTCATAKPIGDPVDAHGISARPLAETVADSVRWLYDIGALSARAAGLWAQPK
ncbi:SDR family NAD(P)-dependent oxidoreductase [Nocardia terpenica]|uniref:SDR family NAD(P)-dependent oxidoreductase n=1 Tax=Nocardia terpenica TaxID=455432 RepID=A0A6G9Z2A6_9NOCA|nr:SDR family NAD(P)-dependent oxidoreductase [Nocardia terpenica]QIS19612.1 SDR family NAD(P)-dependent oxidoreductase [Nocardia terpenica]